MTIKKNYKYLSVFLIFIVIFIAIASFICVNSIDSFNFNKKMSFYHNIQKDILLLNSESNRQGTQQRIQADNINVPFENKYSDSKNSKVVIINYYIIDKKNQLLKIIPNFFHGSKYKYEYLCINM